MIASSFGITQRKCEQQDQSQVRASTVATRVSASVCSGDKSKCESLQWLEKHVRAAAGAMRVSEKSYSSYESKCESLK